MPQEIRELIPNRALSIVQVRVADPTSLNPNQRLPGPGSGTKIVSNETGAPLDAEITACTLFMTPLTDASTLTLQRDYSPFRETKGARTSEAMSGVCPHSTSSEIIAITVQRQQSPLPLPHISPLP